MNTRSLLSTMALSLCALASASGAEIYTISGPVLNNDNGHNYYLLSYSSWTEAETYAQTLGGHLATINNAAEQNWAYNTFSSYGGQSRTVWIGLNDAAAEGSFVWSSGEPVNYTNWWPGEPNSYFSNEDYVFMLQPADAYNRGGYWNDNDNVGTIGGGVGTLQVNGLVEVVPEPSSLALLTIGALAFSLRNSRKNQQRID